MGENWGNGNQPGVDPEAETLHGEGWEPDSHSQETQPASWLEVTQPAPEGMETEEAWYLEATQVCPAAMKYLNQRLGETLRIVDGEVVMSQADKAAAEFLESLSSENLEKMTPAELIRSLNQALEGIPIEESGLQDTLSST